MHDYRSGSSAAAVQQVEKWSGKFVRDVFARGVLTLVSD
jgi:hypothetical protein